MTVLVTPAPGAKLNWVGDTFWEATVPSFSSQLL